MARAPIISYGDAGSMAWATPRWCSELGVGGTSIVRQLAAATWLGGGCAGEVRLEVEKDFGGGGRMEDR